MYLHGRLGVSRLPPAQLQISGIVFSQKPREARWIQATIVILLKHRTFFFVIIVMTSIHSTVQYIHCTGYYH